MQNVGQPENRNIDKVNVQLDVVKSSTPQSSSSSPAKSETETYSGAPAKYMTDSSESEDDSVSEAEMEEEGGGAETSKFLLSHDDPDRTVDPEMQARLEALLEAAGIGKLAGEGKHLADPEVLRRLTSSVSCALDEAAAALTRMRTDHPPHHHRHHHQDKPSQCGSTAAVTSAPAVSTSAGADGAPSLAEACSDGDVGTVRKLLTEGRSVHETTEEGESLLSLACSAGYYELAQVLLAMHASVEDRGIKGDCTPLMEAASVGHVDIVRLLIGHGADVNAVSGSGNTPLMYACAGGHEECVRTLLDHGANVEEHNENGHTPLMEAASAGHVGVAKILLEHGAGINTHSNEFKESALTLACYKGHLDMVRFLLAAGADREHKTDEMHTALMEASMDGHVEVARLLLDSGAQVNMPTDSFESPLTLAACGGHVELAMLLLERGANIEEVNDEGYTPLMEAAREGHEEMVALLLGQGASINAQTEETQETALTLACCGGFLEVADFLIKAGADMELGASTPLMEAAQEGHLELVRYLLNGGADVHAATQTGDTALTYACENGHTDVVELLLRGGAALEHESEGGRTPLMKAARASHLCTVQFLVTKGADVNRMTANGDHTPLSLACAGGHVDVVKFLLACGADPFRKLKDNSSTLIEAAKGGHTAVVQLLLDYPHSVIMQRGNAAQEQVDPAGLSPAQAAQLGLSHVSAPGDPQKQTLVPAAQPTSDPFFQGYFAGLKAVLTNQGAIPEAPATSTAATSPAVVTTVPTSTSVTSTTAPTSTTVTPTQPSVIQPTPTQPIIQQPVQTPAQTPVIQNPVCAPPVQTPVIQTAPPAGKHKCARKQRPAPPQADHHLPPPPDIEDQRPESLVGAQQRKDSLPEADRSLLDLAEPTGPPTLATSALQALDLQFCAQGVTTTPTTPPYPPPQPFPVQQLAANVNQHQLQQLQPQQLQQLAAQHQQCLEQHIAHQYAQEQFAPQTPEEVAVGGGGSGAEARELGAVLAYLQREVPSLVALPPEELRALVLQVMQQRSHEILSSKCSGDGAVGGATVSEGECPPGEECAARRLLAAAEEALDADWPHEPRLAQANNGRQYRVRADTAEPGVIGGEPVAADPRLPRLNQPYDEYRGAGATFAPPLAPLPPPAPTPAPKRDAPHTGHAAHAAHAAHATHAAHPAHAGHTAHTAHTAHHAAPLPLKKKVKGRGGGRGAGAGGRGAGCGAVAASTAPPTPAPAAYSAMDVDAETDSNHDTALTLACAGGHEELVELLLGRGADIEHRDKKGFTPLILAATAGHEKIVEILLNHGADIEAQSERTKDTPLSLACSGGRYEVVELILNRGANKEHRNVSDYTPLSLAASGGYVNIIRLLLQHQAEINSRTGSKLGISPLMLAAMNGHTAAVRLLLDCGSDINAQIETNRNTALTLACFQGRHEVVSLLLDRKANVEHRAKTGLTPLMEAASGGYVEVGRVLLDKGADVNAPPVPSSRDTALTIAADKGHTKFVELLLQRRAAVEVKNKKGNSPLWLAANGGHLAVVEMLYAAGADIDSQDNRKVSCLMAAFRKGHTKVVKWMVDVVTQFPSDQEMTRYICTISDKELLEKCQECVRLIRAAKETQAARANQNATILLEELESERCREESRRQAAARRREKKKKKKMEKKEERRKQESGDKESDGESGEGEGEGEGEEPPKEEGDSGIDANSQGSCSSSDVKAPPAPAPATKAKKKKKEEKSAPPPPAAVAVAAAVVAAAAKKLPDKTKPNKIEPPKPEKEPIAAKSDKDKKQEKENVAPSEPTPPKVTPAPAPQERKPDKKEKKPEEESTKTIIVQNANKYPNNRKSQVFESTRHILEKDDVDASDKNKKSHTTYQWEGETKTSPKGANVSGRREEGWKEVVRKSSVQTISTIEPGCKRVSVASHAISRVIGRAGSNINAIRSATGAHIEVDKQTKGQGERIITIKGSAEATKQAANLIAAMTRDPEADIAQLLPRAKLATPAPPPPQQPKPPKQPVPKQAAVGVAVGGALVRTPQAAVTAPRLPVKHHAPTVSRTAPQRQAHTATTSIPMEKRLSSSTPATPAPTPLKSSALTYTGAIVGARSHTFAAKLTNSPAQELKLRPTVSQASSGSPIGINPAAHVGNSSPVKSRESPPAAEDPATPQRRVHHALQQMSPESSSSWSTTGDDNNSNHSNALHINTQQQVSQGGGGGGAQEYSLFKDISMSGAGGMWGAGDASNVEPHPPQSADASKAPGYRGGCSPCSRTSSHGSTPPPQQYHAAPPQHQIHHIGNNVNAMDLSGLSRNGPMYQDNSRNGHNMMGVSMSSGVGVGAGMSMPLYGGVGVESRLNPRAPDFAARPPASLYNAIKPNHQMFTGGTSAGNLSTLLMSYQQQASQHKPMPPHPYQSLIDRGVNVTVGNVGAVGGTGYEPEERKPRPIGTERAWKLNAPDEWHMHHDHNAAYQSGGVVGGGEAFGAGSRGATAAALSLMQALPLQYLPPQHDVAPPSHHAHAHAPDKQQNWSKWTH